VLLIIVELVGDSFMVNFVESDSIFVSFVSSASVDDIFDSRIFGSLREVMAAPRSELSLGTDENGVVFGILVFFNVGFC